MPVLPPINAPVYDKVSVVLNVARARLNDELVTLAPVGGKLLENNQVFSLQVLNSAWRRMQDALAERGYARLIDEVILQSFPVVASLDPGVQTWVSWSGYFDGASFWPTPALPADLSHPLKVWERWSNQNSPFSGPCMEKMLDGLPATAKTTSNRWWEWRNDAIYMPGSQMVEDLRVRYVKFIGDFADVGSVPWFQQPVPIARCTNPLSWYICAELAVAKQDEAMETTLIAKAESSLDEIFNLDVRADQRVNVRRQPRTGRGYGRTWY